MVNAWKKKRGEKEDTAPGTLVRNTCFHLTPWQAQDSTPIPKGILQPKVTWVHFPTHQAGVGLASSKPTSVARSPGHRVPRRAIPAAIIPRCHRGNLYFNKSILASSPWVTRACSKQWKELPGMVDADGAHTRGPCRAPAPPRLRFLLLCQRLAAAPGAPPGGGTAEGCSMES